MKKSSLIELLSTFSPAEMKSFGDFVKSPYFNKNSKVTELYNIIRKSYPDFPHSSIEKEKIFAKIYPKEEFRDGTLRLLMYYLYECAKKFLQINNFINDEPVSGFVLSAELGSRGMIKECEKAIKDNDNILEKSQYRDEDYFWNKYLNNQELLELRQQQYAGRYEKYMTGEVLKELPQNLTDSYLLRLLKLYTVVLNTNTMYKTKYDLAYYRNIINLFDKNYFKDKQILLVYFHAAMMLENPEDESNYYELKKIIISGEKNIRPNALLDLYINLENYCVRRGRVGISKFNFELFEIYKLEIEKKIYLHGNYMESFFYRSAAVTALLVNETAWAEEFIKKYRDELLPEFRDPAYYHCYARIYIVRKNYDKALESLSKVKTDEIYLKAETRLLFAVVYYELGIEDSLHYLLDTMRHFFKNERYMAESRNEFYSKFVKSLNKLNNIRYKISEDELIKLKNNIDSAERLFLKNWLLEKISELEKAF